MPSTGRSVQSMLEIESEAEKVSKGITQKVLFDTDQCLEIEAKVDQLIMDADDGKFKDHTVDRAPLRNKYFFGEAYTYGAQLGTAGGRGPGNEKLFPKGDVDEIPGWIHKMLVKPLEKAKLVEKNFINSCAINVYLPGGCIVSHIDPPQIFDRPIITISFHSECALCFGCKFTFKPMRVSEPVFKVPLKRGVATFMSGYAADEITHCVRPQDVVAKRSVIILRRCFTDAPRLTREEALRIRSAHQMRNNFQTPPQQHTQKQNNYQRRSLPERSTRYGSSRSNRRDISGSRHYSSTGGGTSSSGSTSRSNKSDGRRRSHSPLSSRSSDRKRGRAEDSSSASNKRKDDEVDEEGGSESEKKKPKLSLVACYGESSEDSGSEDERKQKSRQRRQNAKRAKKPKTSSESAASP